MTDVDKVIEGGYCVGCGACSYVAPQAFSIRTDEIGRRQAIRIADGGLGAADAIADKVCPFSDDGPNEDRIARELFGAPDVALNSSVGYHLGIYAGYVSEASFRANGSSGGFASWISEELLRLGLVEAVLSVGPNLTSFGFEYRITARCGNPDASAKTRYYPVSLDDALSKAGKYGKIAIVGLPCFIKAVRRIGAVDPKFRDQLRFAISLVCGHLKTDGFGKLLAWQLGFQPDELSTIDFRLKLEDRPASRYGVRVTGKDGRVVDSPMSELVGANWGHGLLKYEACDYCDDVFGETADVSVGDAWLQRFENDSRGTNVVVVRNPEILKLVKDAEESGRLKFEALPVKDAEASQAGGLRHRRDGLKFRLLLKRSSRVWAPKKRVEPEDPYDRERPREVQKQRMALLHRSNALFRLATEKRDLGVFIQGIAPDIARLDKLQRVGFGARATSFSRRIVRKLRRIFGT